LLRVTYSRMFWAYKSVTEITQRRNIFILPNNLIEVKTTSSDQRVHIQYE